MQAKFKRNIRDGKEYDRYFPSPLGTNRLVSGHADADNTVAFIIKQMQRTLSQTAKISPVLKKGSLKQTCQAIWDFLYWHIQYETDTPGVEEIETPAYIWHQRETDCDGYTLFAGSILIHLGIPFHVRVTAYDGGWQHVYVIVPMDGNLKTTRDRKKNRSSYLVIDPVADKFDYEAAYSDNFDTPVDPKKITARTLSGIPMTDVPGTQIRVPPGIVRHTQDQASGKWYGWDTLGVMYELTVTG